MSISWTKEQQEVINLRNCDILVSAAAGSGKTAVLVERILSMVTDASHRIDIDRLLIVTFTNAAAGEMRDRIRGAIMKKMEELEQQEIPDTELLDHLQRQVSLISTAQIATIHSFCQYVIRNYFHTIDLDPSLRIADEGEQKLLQNDVLQKLLEEKYKEGNAEFLQMMESLSPGRDDGRIPEMVLSLYHFAQSFPYPEQWLQSCCEAYDNSSVEELGQTEWVKRLTTYARNMLLEAKAQVTLALAVAQEEDGPSQYIETLESDLHEMEDLLRAHSYAEMQKAFADFPGWARLSGKKNPNASEEKTVYIKGIRDEYKGIIKELGADSFYTEPKGILEEMNRCLPLLRALTGLTIEFADRFLEEKQKKNLMDFNDLEHYALKILTDEEGNPTEVAKGLSEHYEEIMIDEYQDSNLVQEMLLTSVSKIREGRHNMFMVGDVKQSIYRFRLARPELFMEKYHRYSQNEGPCRRIDLHQNFRSRREVLSSVNFLFEQIMEHQVGGVEYDEAAALYPGAVFAPGDDDAFRNTEVLLVETSGQSQGEETEESDGDLEQAFLAGSREESSETPREMEARAVACRIREIVGKEVIWDKDLESYRPVSYGDIVILLRTIQGWADVFNKVLTDMDIPAHTGSGTGYFSAIEVQVVLSILKLIDNPRQDIPMAAVLRSPVVGLSGEEMAKIRSAHPNMPFYEACMAYEPLEGFFEMLDEFREMANDTPIHELLRYILERTGYGNYAAAMPGGSQRKANLDMLMEKAIAYEQGSYRGLYHFNRYIENLHKYEIDYGEASAGEGGNVVRIMSIHKSKGLEFPVVFVSGMGKTFNQSDSRSTMVFHPRLGIGCPQVDLKMRTRKDTLLKKLIKKELQLENLGEELRVLYVALTRAKEKLILTGTVGGAEGKLMGWSNINRHQEIILSLLKRTWATSYLDWVIPALMRNKCFADILREMHIEQDTRHPLYERENATQIRIITPKELDTKDALRCAKYEITGEILHQMAKRPVEDVKLRNLLEERFHYRYPYQQEAEIPGKVSVSELKKLSMQEPEEGMASLYEEQIPVPLIPEFMKDAPAVSGADRGTIYHKWMECVDFSLFFSEQNSAQRRDLLEKEKNRMLQAGYLTPDEMTQIDIRKMDAFFASPLASRMAEAARRGELFRERQFVMSMPSHQIRKEWRGDQSVLIQGIIDAYFIESDQIILLDYKTDFVKKEEVSSLCRKYGVQLEYYGAALERLAGLPVAEKFIYSFCVSEVLNVK